MSPGSSWLRFSGFSSSSSTTTNNNNHNNRRHKNRPQKDDERQPERHLNTTSSQGEDFQDSEADLEAKLEQPAPLSSTSSSSVFKRKRRSRRRRSNQQQQQDGSKSCPPSGQSLRKTLLNFLQRALGSHSQASNAQATGSERPSGSGQDDKQKPHQPEPVLATSSRLGPTGSAREAACGAIRRRSSGIRSTSAVAEATSESQVALGGEQEPSKSPIERTSSVTRAGLASIVEAKTKKTTNTESESERLEFSARAKVENKCKLGNRIGINESQGEQLEGELLAPIRSNFPVNVGQPQLQPQLQLQPQQQPQLSQTSTLTAEQQACKVEETAQVREIRAIPIRTTNRNLLAESGESAAAKRQQLLELAAAATGTALSTPSETTRLQQQAQMDQTKPSAEGRLASRQEQKWRRRQQNSRLSRSIHSQELGQWPLGRPHVSHFVSQLQLESQLEGYPRVTFERFESFGDAEDICSPHLTANCQLQAAVSLSASVSAAPGELSSQCNPPSTRANQAGSEQQNRLAFQSSELTNCKHKRLFAKPFERPTAGWIYNALEPEQLNLKLSPTAGKFQKAKLYAASKFRRGSYDEQAGDKDFNIILQSSDFKQIEKRNSCLLNKLMNLSSSSPAKLKAKVSPQSTASSILRGSLGGLGRRLFKCPAPEQTSQNGQLNQKGDFEASVIEADQREAEEDGTLFPSVNNGRQHQQQPRRNSSENGQSQSEGSNSFQFELASGRSLAKSLLDQDYNSTVQLFIKKCALNWNFNSFTFDAICCGRSLTELLLHLFDFYDLIRIFKLDIVNVLKCFKLLEFGYHGSNPYHNSVHAADVTQAMHCFMQEDKIRLHMTDLEVLSSIMAAVCHDLDHPGVNQTFLINTGNPLAGLYENQSVLENHHWRFALAIFKESQLFDHFSGDIYEEMKQQLRQLILATDIARQNEYLTRFRDRLKYQDQPQVDSDTKLVATSEAINPLELVFSMQNTQDRALVLQMALKCADLGNPCRPWLISRVWSNLICDELFKMGQAERELSLPLTSICQREKTSIAAIQTDFFRFIVMPLLELWHKFLNSPLSSLLMSNFEHNYQRWQKALKIVQQLKRRKSVACLERLSNHAGSDFMMNDNAQLISLIILKFYKSKGVKEFLRTHDFSDHTFLER